MERRCPWVYGWARRRTLGCAPDSTFSSGACARCPSILGRSGRRQRHPQGTRRRFLAVIQRCQISPKSSVPSQVFTPTLQTMKEAYKCKSADKARKRSAQALVRGSSETATTTGSLREGMEETLTVVQLALPALLRQSPRRSHWNLNGTIRRVSRNVKRWKSPSMVRRWTWLRVRRIKGFIALRSKQKSLDSDEFAGLRVFHRPTLPDQIQQRPGHSCWLPSVGWSSTDRHAAM